MPDRADEILEQMASAYATCETYQDKGLMTTTFYGPHEFVQRRPFSTRFVRNIGFFYEFRDRSGSRDSNQYVIWTDAGIAHSYWSILPQREKHDSLRRAIAGATGVSGGTAYRVPHLLMPELYPDGSGPPMQTAELVNVPEADVHNCFVIERTPSLGDSEQLWIDRSTYLIRRVVEPRSFIPAPPLDTLDRLRELSPEAAEDMSSLLSGRRRFELGEFESLTTYEASFNSPINRDELVYSPEK